MKRLLKITMLWCLLACWGGSFGPSAAYAAARVKAVDIDSAQDTLRIELSQRVPYKVVRLDARQVMVAFRSATVSEGLSGMRSGDGLVAQVEIESLPNQVVSLMIGTASDVTDVRADWRNGSGTLVVRLVPSAAASPKTIPKKRRKFDKTGMPGNDGRIAETAAVDSSPTPTPSPDPGTEPSPGEGGTTTPIEEMTLQDAAPAFETVVDTHSLEPAATPTPVPAASAPSIKQESGLDGLIAEISRSECSQSPVLKDALNLAGRNEWRQLFDLLGPALDPNSADVCQADYYYLRALAGYRMNRSGDDRLYLDAANYFQDATSYFPESRCTPYGLLALGAIYDDMNNLPEAKGYYSLVLKSYANHPVHADALFRLGNVYLKEGRENQAITTFRKFMEAYPRSPRLTDVRLALGKCLYETDEFADSLAMLRKVMEEDPARIYKDPDLLVYIGYLDYQLGDIGNARETMSKAVNLYPESEAVPDLLTRIADTLINDNMPEQAKKIYQLVMEKYPGTDGYAISAVRYAGLLSDKSEKEARYKRVIEDFPGHPMARLAALRLSDLQSRAGEYAAGIETIRGIMSGNLKDLRNEAAYAMEFAFVGFFRQLSGKADPLAVIGAYEKDKHLINRLDNPDIFEMVGTAFFDAHFYGQAAELFQKTYKLWSPDRRPANLYFQLGVTFQELGKNMQAKEMLDAYFQKVPDDQIVPEACLRMSRLLIAEKSWESALAILKTGIRSSASDLEKADFLVAQAGVYQELGKEVNVPGLLIEAINLMASSPNVLPGQLMQAHRSLGESYSKLDENEKAVDAFTMALKFSTDRRPPGLLFMLAESNIKAHRPEAAKDVLREIIGSGDDFWARIAQERLRTMALEEKLKES